MYFSDPAGRGAGVMPERIDGARVFVVPNPSGLNASFPGFSHKLVWFRRLRQFADRVTPGAGAPGAFLASSGRGRSRGAVRSRA
jgi:hypothetical protein